MPLNISDYIGKKYNRLTIVSSEPNKGGHTMCKSLCDCGNYKICRLSAILSNNTLSCGCLNTETRRKMIKARAIPGVQDESGNASTEYRTYQHMKGRCYTKTNNKYKNYGARGIAICDRWLASFENFLEDMGKKPSRNHTIERVNVNGNYEPSNCIWATPDIQGKNKRNNVFLILKGEKIHQAGLAHILNVDPHAIEYHIKKGKTGDEIFLYFNKKACSLI